MRTLVTHINPHLDDIAAIWLFKRFHPEFENAKIEFISAEKGAGGLKESKDLIYFGVGKGRFDEHKGDIGDCATSLVWKEIKKEGLVQFTSFEQAAYEDLVRWNLLIDTARMPRFEFSAFGVDSFIRSHKNSSEDSLATLKLGEQILVRILPVLIRRQMALVDWKKRVAFKTKWGKGVGLESDSFFQDLAYGNGFVVVINKAPKRGFSGITALATSDTDLTPVFLKLKDLEPKAGWFLHHAKKMVLCGAPSAPDAVKSKLTLKELIEVVKSI